MVQSPQRLPDITQLPPQEVHGLAADQKTQYDKNCSFTHGPLN